MNTLLFDTDKLLHVAGQQMSNYGVIGLLLRPCSCLTQKVCGQRAVTVQEKTKSLLQTYTLVTTHLLPHYCILSAFFLHHAELVTLFLC